MSKKTFQQSKTVIICGTDFTPSSSHAADVAAAMSRCMNTPLELVHALTNPPYSSVDKKLESEVNRLRSQEINIQEFIVGGRSTPDEELVSRAKKKPCELLVVSSHGRRTAKRWLLGSTSERTAERASVPTLIVKDAHPFLKWTQGERPLNIFIAFNQTKTSEAALRWVKTLQELAPCKITVGYAYSPREQLARLGNDDPLSSRENSSEIESILERNLRESAKKILGTSNFEIYVRPFGKKPANTLADMVEESESDLLIVGSHQHEGFERVWHTSISRNLLQNATTNVAVVPLSTNRAKSKPVPPTIKKILVPTDFSELATESILHACSLLSHGGEIQLIHVIHPRALPNGEYLQGTMSPSFFKSHAKQCKISQQKLETSIPTGIKKMGIQINCKIVENDDAALGIYKAAERFNADAICIGTHGHTGLGSTILGSTTMALLNISRKPLYLVRGQEE